MDQLKLELKRFEKKFEQKHGRPPARDDVRALPEIKNKYKRYSALQLEKQRLERDRIVLQETPHRDEPIELGPTPQIYGKAIGLFDMSLSPLKPTTVLSPEKNKTEQVEGIEIHQVRRRLDLSLTPKSSPKKRSYGPNSPMKFDNIQLSVQTPRRNLWALVSGSMSKTSSSPSPLIKRPTGKPLRQILEEHEKILEDIEAMSDDEVTQVNIRDVFQDDDNAAEDDSNEETVIHKRSKRKHVLRPTKEALKDGEPISVNIHEEMARLKQQAIDGVGQEIAPPIDNAVKVSASKARRRNNKFNLVSNNFRRLKLASQGQRTRQ